MDDLEVEALVDSTSTLKTSVVSEISSLISLAAGRVHAPGFSEVVIFRLMLLYRFVNHPWVSPRRSSIVLIKPAQNAQEMEQSLAPQ